MSQLSRPYQIALAAVAVLGLVWLVALRGHGSGPSEPAPSKPSASAPSSSSASGSAASSPSASPSSQSSSGAPQTRSPGAPTPIYHGPAPGVEGLTRDIAKAHEAVGGSEKEAKRFEHASAQSPASAAKATGAPARAGVPSTPALTVSTAATPRPNDPTAANTRPAQQLALEKALLRHQTVLLVFWNPKSSVDAKVRGEADGLARGSKGHVVAFDAQPSQVGLFGPVTEVSHVYETPTVLIVNGHGVVSTITGLTDSFSLKSAVAEAQQAK